MYEFCRKASTSLALQQHEKKARYWNTRGRSKAARPIGRGPVGQRKGEVLMPGRSRMTGECILLNSGSETLKKVQEAMKSGKL